ncbi:MAG: hypothetical protein KAU28_00435, partial [Phycisphaerae bacterium]|nr:hypothetical protein [Phycisphaerae bacterium]
YVVTATSDKAMLAMSPEEFIDWVIVERFAPRYVVEGRNFFFGHGREGTVEILRGAGAAKGFAVHVIDPVMLKVAETLQRVSSTLIRSLVAAGEVADAARCLGRTFTLYGSVIAGRGQGRQLEFPTANLALGEQVIPADGVYAGRACVAGSQFISAISIGVKPTLGPEERTVEAYLIDADGDYYNKPMSLSFVQRLRGQMKFDGVESLRAQIEKDVQRVEEICG